MQSESLIIKNFGPIKCIELPNLNRINVFIGESGSGKSTVMKVLAMMRWVYKMLCVRSYFKNSGIPTPFRLRTESILGTNGLRPFLRPDSEIIYRNGSFEIQLKKSSISFPVKYVDNKELTLQKIAYISDKRVLVPDLAAGNVTLRHNMFYLDETFLNFQKALDVISSTDMDYLGVKMTVRKTSAGQRVFVSSITKDDSSFENLPLTSASSGMQSSVALHFITRYLSRHFDVVEAMNSTIVRFLAANDNLSRFKGSSDIGSFPNKRISLHLEEPELSLFPSNQWGLMKFLINECLSAQNAEMDLTLATHSPYILTALNIMMLAHRASLTGNFDQHTVNEVIPQLDPSEVGAWHIIKGGAHNLFDDEIQMIDGSGLDSTSDSYENIILTLNDMIYG